MLLDDATSWKEGSKCATSREQVQRRGKGTRKERDEGSLWGLTSIQRTSFHQLTIRPVVWGQRSHEIKVRGSRLFFSIYFFFLSRLLSSDREKERMEMWKVPAVRGVSGGGKDSWTVDDLILHMVVLGQSQWGAAIAPVQNWEVVGRQKQQKLHTDVRCSNFRER